MYTVRRTIELDAGHRVPYHASKCRHLHGHRYAVTAILAADDLIPAATTRSDAGMVVDFGGIKQALLTAVHDPFDHKLILWQQDPLLQRTQMETALGHDPQGDFWRALHCEAIADGLVQTPCIPTAEELARFWGELFIREARKLFHATPMGLWLQALEVRETPTSTASWLADVRLSRL